ncbi:hypothetical protein CEXT_522062 [Caerostris extrusa]|uniref:ILEI/PANDER domain-containing protein n=1 Tax=Caerostris extrusa TaxID=172846 RepID=A0AAV4UTC9_CAEEX|nr:hypothetical protein CEXT_522062 [Caerostris extrusa]
MWKFKFSSSFSNRVGTLYLITFYFSLNNGKVPPSLEAINETGYTDMPIIVNTETTNVMLRKQQVNHVYERPKLANETVSSLHSIQIGNYTHYEPRLCVDGKYIVSKNVNEGGRGLNIAVIDNLTRTIIRVGHFDTYEKESTVLETLLLTLRPGDILILITFDESSRKLSRIARLLFYDLGSALIQNLNYRSSCNPPRVEFCNQHEDLPLFCDADVINDPLVPSPVWKQPASSYKICNVPVIVMSGENVQFLPLTLETLVRQPGIKTSIVVVYHLAKIQWFKTYPNYLVSCLKNCPNLPLTVSAYQRLLNSTTYSFLMQKNYFLLEKMLYWLPIFVLYGTAITCFGNRFNSSLCFFLNENGFKNVSGDASTIYRVESFAGVAMLVRKDFFQKSWCQNDSQIDPLYISSNIAGVNIVPDVSRVTLAAPLTITYEQNILLKYPEKLHQQEYDSEIESLLMAAAVLAFDIDSMKQCLHEKEYFQIKIFEELPLFVNNSTSLPNRVLAIFYYQENEQDILTLQHLCNCLGLFSSSIVSCERII